MLRNISAKGIALIFTLIFLTACKQAIKPETRTIAQTDRLHHTVPASFHLRLARAMSQSDRKSYYYEVALWMTQNGDISARVEYEHLLNDYVFTDESISSMADDLANEYEDALLSQDPQVALGVPSFRGSYIHFTVKDGDCFYYRSFKLFGSAFGEVATSPLAVLVGDSRFSSFVCDFSGNKMSKRRIHEWVDGVTFRLVHLNEI